MEEQPKTPLEILEEMDWKSHWEEVLKSSAKNADNLAEARRMAREKNGQRRMD